MATDDTKAPPLDSELGTVLSYADSLFIDYIDPTVGSVSIWQARDYQQMLSTDGQARKVETVLTLPLFSAGRSFEPAKGDKGEAEWITDALTRPANNGGMSTPLSLVIAQMTSAVTYRVASFEKVFTRRDGRIVYDKLAFRPAVNTRVIRDRKNGAYRGLEQDPPAGGFEPVKIPARRAFTYVHGQHRHPILGTSDMEIPLTCWRTKQKLKFLWFLFLELHAQPRVAWSADSQTGGSHDGSKSAAKMWSRMRAGGSVALPPGVDGKVLEAGGNAADLYLGALKYLDGEMTGQVLADFANLAGAASDGRGSFALSRDQSDFYMMTRRAVADEMSEAVTNFVVADLIRLNFGPNGAVPRFKLGPLVKPDLETLLSNLASVAKPEQLPAEFVSFVIESTARLLEMPEDKVAAMVTAMTEAAERAAETPGQAALAPVAGTVAAADQLVRGTERGRAVVAAATAPAGAA